MKTERRHELQTNILADWLGHKTEAIRPYFKHIVGAVAAVFIVAILATVMSNQQFERSSRGWADYFAASTGDNPDRLRTVAEEHAGTLPAVWATQREADLELARGIRALYTSRGESTEALGTARSLYLKVEAGAAGQPVLMQAAQFGTAQAFEAEGDVAKAIEYYEKAIAAAKDSSVGKQAQARLDRLQDKDAKDFLAWFARQTPQPRTPPGGFPGGGFPGAADGGPDVPFDLTEIPDRPELTIPEPATINERASSLPTDDPTTPEPTTPEPTTPEPTTPEPTTPEPTTPEPTTPEPTTPEPTTPEPTTPEPTTPEPTTPEPTTPEPTTPEPTTPEPTTPEPTTPEPTTPEPTTPEPTTPEPATPEPATPEPATPEPATPEPATPEPATPEPATPEPATPEPATPEPATPEPATPEPATPEPATPEPATPEPATPEPAPAPEPGQPAPETPAAEGPSGDGAASE